MAVGSLDAVLAIHGQGATLFTLGEEQGTPSSTVPFGAELAVLAVAVNWGAEAASLLTSQGQSLIPSIAPPT